MTKNMPWRYLWLAFLVLYQLAQSAAAVDLVGYLPYYRMGASYNSNILPTQLGMLNEVRYFGLTAGSDGSIQPLAGSGTIQTHQNNIAVVKQKIDAMPAALRPRLDITFGGAGEAANFATIAASASLSTIFAQNISSLLTQTGATSVDIDWESPDNHNSIQLSNYATLLQRIKHGVGPNRVYATIEPQIKLPKTVFEGPDAITGISLMTYDLSWWANDPADTNRGEHSLPQYVSDSVHAWTDPYPSPNRRTWVFPQWGLTAIDAADEQSGKLVYGPGDLGIGLPFYAHPIGTSQSPLVSSIAYTYAELVSAGTPDASGNYYTYAGQTSWLPGPSLAAQRVQFANDTGIGQLFIWELGQDVSPTNPNSLLRTAFLKNETLGGDFDGDHDSDAADYDIWRASVGSTTDLRADANGDGLVDAGDYIIWRKHAAAAGASAMSSSSVPEPSVWLALVTTGLVAMSKRHRTLRPDRRRCH